MTGLLAMRPAGICSCLIAAILKETCNLFTNCKLCVAANLKKRFQDNLYLVYLYLPIYGVEVEPVSADQVLMPPYWKNVVFSLTAS